MKGKKYIPTPAEEKLLAVLADPDFRGRTITAKCEAAGVGTAVYTAAVKKPGFLDLIHDITISLAREYALETLQAVKDFAVTNSRCAADRKLLLEIANIYKNEQSLIFPKKEEVLTEDQIKARIKEISEQLNAE